MAILSFSCSSLGDPDGLWPQHLKEMIGPSGDGANNLVRFLVAFVALVLSGEVPVSTCPFYFGASMIVIQKRMEQFAPLLLAVPFIVLLPRWVVPR